MMIELFKHVISNLNYSHRFDYACVCVCDVYCIKQGTLRVTDIIAGNGIGNSCSSLGRYVSANALGKGMNIYVFPRNYE